MQRNEHFGRSRRERRRDNQDHFFGEGEAGAWDRELEGGGRFSRGGRSEDYRGTTRGGYPGYGAGDAGGHGRRSGDGEGALDRRSERRQKFSEDFNKWRSSRPDRAEGSRTTTQAVTKNK
jgi:hypothetical protein